MARNSGQTQAREQFPSPVLPNEQRLREDLEEIQWFLRNLSRVNDDVGQEGAPTAESLRRMHHFIFQLMSRGREAWYALWEHVLDIESFLSRMRSIPTYDGEGCIDCGQNRFCSHVMSDE